MSTYFYPFRDPISSAILEVGAGHDLIHVWQAHAKSGVLTVKKGVGLAVLALFRSDRAVFHRVHGGETLGTIIHHLHGCKHLKLDDFVSDDYGALFTVSQVLAMQGMGQVTTTMPNQKVTKE